MKKLGLYIYLLFVLFILPLNIYAFSNKVILGGDTIGIEVLSDGIYVVGFYDVRGREIASDAGFKIGDIIKSVNDIEVNSINDLNKTIDYEGNYKFTVLRNNSYNDININLFLDDDIIKTGLYVKDIINGIGTLSYIDPNSRIFGSLGHEILESSSLEKFIIKSGNIYKAEVSSIKKSDNGVIGEKRASYNKNNTIGDIYSNEISGIFGKYLDNIDDFDTIDIAYPNEIKKGLAYIRTSIDKSTIDLYKIKIISINEGDASKNILFEIIDDKLLNSTGGIIQGMSGSPIIQDNKIIGVVNYVIVDDVEKGYGIFITTMLEEGDKVS